MGVFFSEGCGLELEVRVYGGGCWGSMETLRVERRAFVRLGRRLIKLESIFALGSGFGFGRSLVG